ncbi:MAG: hypothetical protein KJ065_14830 [Anaerolineae bacterium]|nr:hypothetical protein [Anaerolineae bacterium]
MRKFQLLALLGVLLVAAGFGLLAQSRALAQDAPMEEPPYLAEYYNAWMGSAHAAADTEAFRHWDDEGEVPVECARCHSTPGYRDYVGQDGSEFGVVDAAAPTGTVITCDACHAPNAVSLTSVTFPSGAVIEMPDGSRSGRCMVCHQGRASTDTVNNAIADAGVAEDLNTPSADLGFINVHYYAAAASLFGSEARGGYQYDGKIYQLPNEHVPGLATCADCHNPHTLEIKVDVCAECHDVETQEDLRYIRMQGSSADYDGDEDIDEGIAEEIEGLQEMLLEAIQLYAEEVVGTPIAYNSAAYPYFFLDADGNGEVDDGETDRYNAFTGNLLKAAYNLQFTYKDPGGFAHNPTYHIELLYDSIESLNAQVSDPVDLTFASRTDPGHFDVTAEAFRHWDEDGMVPGTCARCHSAEGLPVFLANGANIAEEPSNSLACSTCHTSLSEFTLYEVNEVAFPSGARLSFGEGAEANLCLACHQGRESTVSVNAAIGRAGVGPDEVSDALSFRNVHYFAAGATLFGSEAQGAYQYEGKEYNGRFMHAEEVQTCTDCHRPHSGTFRVNICQDCHEDVEEQEDVLFIRLEPEGVDAVDYDGDGDAEEPIRDEVMALEDALLAEIQKYATETAGTPIIYESHTHPYWYIDGNGNGVVDEGEVTGDTRYVTWTPTLLQAAYNYQYIQKDPGVFAHNGDYALQILYDSLEAIGGPEAVANFTRPPVR